MAKLEELAVGAWVKGVLPDALVNVIDVKWHGSSVIELTYKDAAGRLGNELLYRDREPTLEHHIEPTLRRERLHRGIISEEKGYSTDLIGWVEVV